MKYNYLPHKTFTSMKKSKEDIMNDADFLTFRKRVRELCKERGLTLVDLAEKMGVTTGSLAVGQRPFYPTLKNMKAYADVLNVPVWELMHDCGESAVITTDVKKSVFEMRCPECGTELMINIGVTEKYDMSAGVVILDPQPLGKSIRDRIRRIMAEKKITVSNLAERCGCTQQNISSSINSANISLSTLSYIAKGIGVEMWELLEDKEKVECERIRRMVENNNKRVVTMNADIICPHCHKLIKVLLAPN